MEYIQFIIRMVKRKKKDSGSMEKMKDCVHFGLKMVNERKKGFIKVPKVQVFGPIGIRMETLNAKDIVAME